MSDSATRDMLLVPVLAALTLAVSACSNTSTDTSSTLPTSSATSSTETFSGSIGQNGIAIHTFAIKTSGYTVMAGFTTLSPSTVSALGLGIGYWDATTSTCGLNQTQNDAARSGSTAVSGTAGAGNYCVRVYDGGNLSLLGSDVVASYTLQVQHY